MKKYCAECDGRDLCKTPLCNTIAKIKKYNGYCLNCFIHLFFVVLSYDSTYLFLFCVCDQCSAKFERTLISSEKSSPEDSEEKRFLHIK